jgi:hypothetical protein
MNAAADRARAETKRIVNANAAVANSDVPPVVQAPPVIPLVAPAAALPLAHVVIGNAALAQLLAACQPQPHATGAILPERAGSTRLKAFSSRDSVEWMSWKTHYLEACEINAWPNIHLVREARAAMSEKAARHTADVVPVYIADLAAILPVLEGSHCEVPGEVHAGCRRSVLPRRVQHCKADFVGRCLRNLYNRAYPGKEVDNNLPLIKKFVTQLINKEVGKFVFEREPQTFAGAQTKTATDMTFKSASRASIHAFANPSENGINYSGRGPGGG